MIYPKNINEIIYENKKGKAFAKIEFNLIGPSIDVYYLNNKLTFIPKNFKNEDMEEFWDKTVESSFKKKLKDLDDLVEEMKAKFEKV